MLLQVMLSTTAFAGFIAHPLAPGHLVVARASLSIPDTLFLFVVALVVFGPKRLPEIGKQIGKLVFEFRRASNDFKLQIEEELRVAEQQDRQKQAQAATAATAMLQNDPNKQIPSRPTTPAMEAMQLAANAKPIDFSDETPATALPEPPDRTPNSLAIHPPSTGTPVSALPPNHTAVNAPSTETPSSESGAEVTSATEQTGTHHG